MFFEKIGLQMNDVDTRTKDKSGIKPSTAFCENTTCKA